MTPAPAHLVSASELAPPGHEQCHRLRRALLGADTAHHAVQPIEMLRRLVEAVRHDTLVHILQTEHFDAPHEWADCVEAARRMTVELIAALRGVPCPETGTDAEFADPWAALRAAGYGPPGP